MFAAARLFTMIAVATVFWPGAELAAGVAGRRVAARQLAANPPPLTFAVIGDNGTGKAPQYEVARQMLRSHADRPFELVVMVGDNLYGSQQPRDFVDKFEIPYGPLLRMGIPFHAALGNHDAPESRNYPKFNMNGQRYYSFVRGPARFFVFDTNFMDPPQVKWIETALAGAQEEWKIVVFHHPIYSDGDRHGPNVSLRVVLEPLLVRHGVDVVFTGHEHIYERIREQKGIPHFIVGSSGQLRKGGVTPSPDTAASFADDNAFLIATIAGAEMAFQAISRTGDVVDSGVLRNRHLSEW
ncbi:MAG TPA: metallophosphoesterase [Vicinamibacterales bacterium]|nr:metallophosphoesterase [Vicinamibacterales bacterium]